MDHYEDAPYESFAFAHTHPWRLAIVGRAFGVATAAPATCRVLELGCGTGWNAAAIAASLPAATVVAIDREPRHIELARALAAPLGATNLTFRVGDLASLDARELGVFDYVIAHGVYGWVPPAVNDRLLALSREVLAPGGLLYLSANVYPGAYARSAVRRIMQRHAGPVPSASSPLAAAEAGRGLILRLAEAGSELETWWAGVLEGEAAVLAANPPSYTLHDHLAPDFAPVWFDELADHARCRGLRYVADAQMSTALGLGLPDALRQTLVALATGPEHFQALLDAAVGRAFRRAVFARDDAALVPDGVPAALGRACFASSLEREPSGARSVGGRLQWVSPAADRALSILRAHFPCTLSFEALRAALATGDDAVPHDDLDEALAMGLFEAWGKGLVEVLAEAPPIAALPTAGTAFEAARPRVAESARVEARAGRSTLTNLYHVGLEVPADVRALVPLLDGTRSVAELVASSDEADTGHVASRLAWLSSRAFFVAM